MMGYATNDPKRAKPLEETSYWYDRRGLLVRASNQAGLVELERDDNGRIVNESVNGRRVEHKLDARGNSIERRIGRSQIGEGLVQYAHDPLGMVASITIDDHAPLAFTRDPLGREVQRASTRGFRLDQSWSDVGQMSSQRAGHKPSMVGFAAVRQAPALGLSAERHYAWDKAGAPLTISDSIRGETRYAYACCYTASDPIALEGGMRLHAYVDAPTTGVDPVGLQLNGPGGFQPKLPGQTSPGSTFSESVKNQFLTKGDQVVSGRRIYHNGKKYSVADHIVIRNGKVRFIVESKGGSRKNRLRTNQAAGGHPKRTTCYNTKHKRPAGGSTRPAGNIAD